MQALQKKQAEEQKMRELLATDANRSIEERVAHSRALLYEEHKGAFAIAHSSIHKAAADGSIDGLKFFLSSNHRPKVRIDDFDKNGFCPLHSAAVRGADHSIRYLIEQGCSVDVRSTYGDTALMHACKENQLSSISLLFGLGAQISLSNKAGFTAIHMAAQADNVESLKLLAELIFKRHKATEDDEETAPGAIDADDASQASESVVSRSEDDSLSMTSFLGDPAANAELGEFLNQQANNSMTPLHIASMNNSQRVVEFLLLHRVRLDVRDSSGETALHKAGRKQLSKIYAEMRDAGASESIKNNFGETPRDLFIDNPSY